MPEVDVSQLESRVDEILNRHPAVGMAVGVVRDGRLEFFHGHGLADLASNTPVTEDTVFRMGSLTKTVTAIAVMQLWEQGLLDLDAPANAYIRAYELVPLHGAHQPATVRHLLTHTSGLPELVHPARAYRPILGETVAFGQPVPTLAEFYGGRLRLVAEPGTGHTYSNHNFATLAQIVEEISGNPIDRYVREHIFAPLGMADSDLVRSDRVRARLATGYALRSHGPRPVRDCDVVTVGAGALYSTTRDMARYIAALLHGGSGEHGSILKAETLGRMFAPQYQPDPRLPGVGLAFFRHDLHGHLVVEHDGLLPGFSSQISIAPDDGIGVVACTNGARGAKAWLGAETTGLLRYSLGVADDAVRTDVPHRPQIWGDVCGWYAFRGSARDVQRWFIAGAEVFVDHGRLMIRPVTPVPGLMRGLPLCPDDDTDPYVFRIDLSKAGIGTSRVVFSRASGAEATSLHLDFAPLSFDRRPAITNPRPWAAATLAGLAVAAATRAVRRRRSATAGGRT
jgi:CubicO group peptidase (beta-lactamase class C family)